VTTFFIDVSHHDWNRRQGNMDWVALKNEGIDFVCIRATYGDPLIYNPATRYFREMASAAKQAGLVVGGYHNLIRGDAASMKRQVDYFKAELDAVDADWAMVDIEPYDALKENGLWPRYEDGLLFAQTWATTDTRKLSVYLAQWVWSGWLKSPVLTPMMDIAGGPLISSRYVLGAEKGPYKELYTRSGGDSGPGYSPYGGVTPEIWQYSSNSAVTGATAPTDADAYKGSVEDLRKRLVREAPVAWELVPALVKLRENANRIAPNRDKASDGSIGDLAHCPKDDPTPSSKHCPNSKGEVLALDLDVDFKQTGVTMTKFIDAILDSPADKAKLKNIIYNRRIASRSWGWTWRDYDGANAHDKHAHFEAYDSTAAKNSTSNWAVLSLEAFVMATKAEVVDAVKGVVQAEIKAALNEALFEVMPYQAAGPRTRLKAAGWGDVSTRTLLEYLLENTNTVPVVLSKVNEAAQSATLRGEQILRKVTEDDADFAQAKAYIDDKIAEFRTQRQSDVNNLVTVLTALPQAIVDSLPDTAGGAGVSLDDVKAASEEAVRSVLGGLDNGFVPIR
jgi:hypothetical protein